MERRIKRLGREDLIRVGDAKMSVSKGTSIGSGTVMVSHGLGSIGVNRVRLKMEDMELTTGYYGV